MGGDIKVPIFPRICGHLEFLWDLSVHSSIGLFIFAHHVYSFSWGGREGILTPLPGCILPLLSVFWVCDWVRGGSLLITPFAWGL